MKIDYTPEPTPYRFHQSAANVRGIMGPIGSGKSVACCLEIFNCCMHQAPDASGVRKSRWAVVRNSYPELRSTTIQTWQAWIPEEICPITYTAPIEGHLEFPMPDGTRVEALIYFLALDKPKDTRKLLSLELTGVWINEAREIGFSVIKAAFSRTGRYPKKADAPITWTGMIMDTNPPDTDHWWYRMAEEKPDRWEDGKKIESQWQFFRQPAALIPVRDPNGRISGWKANPAAENVHHHQLGYQYWLRLTEGADVDWILVHCCGEYGNVFTGKPVYMHAFNDVQHVSMQPLGMFRGLPILLGWDFGLTPACVICQITPGGQFRVLRELVCERGGIKQFAGDAVKPMLAQCFPGMPIDSIGDPAGVAGAQADIELSPLAKLAQMGIPTRPAASNDFSVRRQAVLDRLFRTVDDGKPAFIIDPSCKMLIDGFRGGYHFERVQVTGEERFKDQPAKNKFSHVADALQYAVMGADSLIRHATTPPPPPQVDDWEGII